MQHLSIAAAMALLCGCAAPVSGADMAVNEEAVTQAKHDESAATVTTPSYDPEVADSARIVLTTIADVGPSVFDPSLEVPQPAEAPELFRGALPPVPTRKFSPQIAAALKAAREARQEQSP